MNYVNRSNFQWRLNPSVRLQKNKIFFLKKIASSKACETKISELLNGEELKNLTHEILNSLLADELKIFILSHDPNVTKSRLPKKGKVGDAIKGEKNLIRLAFDLRDSPNILESQLSASESDLHTTECNSSSRDFIYHSVVVTSDPEVIRASTLLGKPNWMDDVEMCFNSNHKMKQVKVTDEIGTKADILQRVLNTRLTKHLNICIEQNNIRKHWSFAWARKNMGVVSALMTLYDMVKDKVIMLDENSTLLKSKDNYILVGADESNKHGAYLYYDNNDEKWIRSGKTTGNPFIVRHQAHAKKGSGKDCIIQIL